jgi:hypothetical protein
MLKPRREESGCVDCRLAWLSVSDWENNYLVAIVDDRGNFQV